MIVDLLAETSISGYPACYFAPTYKMMSEVWREMSTTLRPIASRVSAQERRLELITGGVVDMWSLDQPNAARGRKYKRVAVDEAGMVKDLQTAWEQVIRPTLADYITMPGVYPAGRLDLDSEGLLLLTDDGRLQARIADPRFKQPKTYLVQVEGEPNEAALAALRGGVRLKDGMTLPAEAERIDPPALWPRDPPVRFRKSVPDCWLQLIIREGRNRQVRRMTAAVGHPTLRLVRWAIGGLSLDGITPGEWRQVEAQDWR